MLTIGGSSLLDSLMPRSRILVLATLISEPTKKWHVRALARATGLSAPTVQEEAASLAEGGIINRERSGNRLYYMANASCPIYSELRSIIVKTVGVAEPIRQALAPVAARIRLAYIYGSQASGGARPDSDIDVMIVGGVSGLEVAVALDECEAKLGRDINATVYPEDEYARKLAEREGFVYRTHGGLKIMLVGELDELG